MRLYDQLTSDDCFVACVKSFLPETLHASMPNHTDDGHTWSANFTDYLYRHGYEVRFQMVTEIAESDNRDGELCILSGQSLRDTHHAVIGKIFPSQKTCWTIHDPHKSRSGLLGVSTVYRISRIEDSRQCVS